MPKKKENKPKLGSGERFKKLKGDLEKKGAAGDPAALAAWIGRKKYGDAAMQKMAQTGKKRKSK